MRKPALINDTNCVICILHLVADNQNCVIIAASIHVCPWVTEIVFVNLTSDSHIVLYDTWSTFIRKLYTDVSCKFHTIYVRKHSHTIY